MQRPEVKGFHFYDGRHKWLVRGVTYGPFRPDAKGDPYPAAKAAVDLPRIAASGVNTLRLYEVPSQAFAEQAAEHGLRLMVDIPWPKHLNIYEDPKRMEMCLEMVEQGVRAMRDWPNLAGVFLGNEIPSDQVRWVGPARVEAALLRMYRLAKRISPDLPVGFANYPATEYLRVGFFDFLGFNVYLHDAKDFREYLVRLRHLYPDLPLLLSEVGMDAVKHGADVQAEHLRQQLGIVYDVGMAGAFVFSWTDEWHTGGFDITQWAFGLVDIERCPKPAYHAVSEVFQQAPQSQDLPHWPRVSVVVATYNGGRTLRECLESLQDLRYGDYEVIVVDDGSTDDTQAILHDFPQARVITQTNQGLSVARNAGIAAANGEVVAFTDSDCYADPDWLYHLVVCLEQGNLAGVGGPNLTPIEAGAWPRSIAHAPGHATHVLLSHQEAEHVPGCNMAFRRAALLDVDGFDPVFRKAGDDVDVIWRLQDAGARVGFSTSGFVWHHRRQGLRAYWRQQAGYGEAEALLLRKHPHRFNERGDSLWRGAIYAGGVGAAWRRANVYFGVYASSGYQCIYEKSEGNWRHQLTSLEWWLACLGLLGAGLVSQVALALGMCGAAISLGVGLTQAWHRWSRADDLKPLDLLRVWLLWVGQPIARGGARYLGRLQMRGPSSRFRQAVRHFPRVPTRFARARVREYWSDDGAARLDILRNVTQQMAERQWWYSSGSGWEPWDVSVAVSWWFKARLVTSSENHGERKRLLRCRLRLSPTTLFAFLMAAGALVCAAMAFHDTIWARYMLAGLLAGAWVLYRRALRGRAVLETLVDEQARALGFQPLEDLNPTRSATPVSEPDIAAGEPRTDEQETQSV